VLAIASAIALPILYGSAFRAAVLPAEIILIGLSVEGAAAVTSAFLLGIRRPGLNSWGMAAGVAVTVSMDLYLIPRYGARGGAITSAVAYLTTTCVLFVIFRAQCRRITGESGRSRGGTDVVTVDRASERWPEDLNPGVLEAIIP
jgi:O-antigen/teichoic acid export membrane protein